MESRSRMTQEDRAALTAHNRAEAKAYHQSRRWFNVPHLKAAERFMRRAVRGGCA